MNQLNQKDMELLNLKSGNVKLDAFTYVFDLPAGFSCPNSKDCKSQADRKTGKITDGPDTKFRCYAASNECIFVSTREYRWHNFDLLRGLKTTSQMVKLIVATMNSHIVDEAGHNKKMLNVIKKFPEKANSPVLFRLHSAGDFFNQNYFDAWLTVARMFPNIIFYAYTKSLNFWAKRITEIPENLRLTASYGGKFDFMIEELNLKFAKVVFTQEEADSLGLKIDKGDLGAWSDNKSFALWIHGTQPKNSVASAANSALKKAGIKNGFYMKVKFKSKKEVEV